MYMDKVVRKFISHPINGDDVLNICNYQANLLSNSELKKYRSIDQVLGKYGACVILYDKNNKPGHWSCIIKQRENLLEFFCSYGMSLDEANEYTGGHNYLSSLINRSKYNVYFSTYQLQKDKKDINVCGRYVGCRILLRDVPIDEFVKLFINNSHYDSDFWVCCITLFCEN